MIVWNKPNPLEYLQLTLQFYDLRPEKLQAAFTGSDMLHLRVAYH